MVSKSPKWGYSPSKWPKSSVNGPIRNLSKPASTLAGDVGDVADAMEGGEGEGDTCGPDTDGVTWKKPGWVVDIGGCPGWSPPNSNINGVVSHKS